MLFIYCVGMAIRCNTMDKKENKEMARKYELDISKFTTFSQLEAKREQLARIANTRLRALEKAGRDYWSYDSAVNYTQATRGTNRFSNAKHWRGTEEGLVSEIQRLLNFLNSKSSTVSGSKAIESRIHNTFKARGRNLDNPREFFNFLNSSYYKKLSNKYISSDKLQEYFDRRITDGDTVESIHEELQLFLDGTIEDVDELFTRSGYSLIDEDE